MSLPRYDPYSVHDQYFDMDKLTDMDKEMGSAKYYANHKSISWSEKNLEDESKRKASKVDQSNTIHDKKPKDIKFHYDVHHIFNLDANEIYDVIEEDIASDSSDSCAVIEEEISNVGSNLTTIEEH